MADYDMGRVFHFAADGTELWQGASFYGPQCVAVNKTDNSVWVTDVDLGEVIHLAANGSELWRGAPTPSPEFVAVNPTDGTVWVSDWVMDKVLHLTPGGAVLWQGSNFYGPECVSVNPTDGSVWVADNWNMQVVHLSASGTELWRSSLLYDVYWVAVNPSDGSCWFSDYGGSQVVHVTSGGTVLAQVPMSCPDALAVDTRNGSCWVLDICFDQLVHLSRSGAGLSATSGFLRPSWLSLDPTDKSCWIADYWNSQVVRLQLATFPDVPFGFWAREEVDACVEAHIVSGYDDGLYRPSDQVTRDQMAVYVSRALAGGDSNVPTPTEDPGLSDILPGHWAYKYIAYAVKAKVVQGYPEGDYRPSQPVDRAQMAVYVARSIVDPTGEDGLTGYTPPTTPSFPDVASSFWAFKHIEYCVEEEVVKGYEDGKYHPEVVVTRDQMAVYICRAFGLSM
jgi:hypothetical protein